MEQKTITWWICDGEGMPIEPYDGLLIPHPWMHLVALPDYYYAPVLAFVSREESEQE